MSAQDKFMKLMDHFLQIPDVKKQGNSLKKNRKMFAMWTKNDQFVVKLPEERVNILIDTGKGLPYDPGTGKYMKEWVIIPPSSLESWIGYAEEAKQFAPSSKK